MSSYQYYTTALAMPVNSLILPREWQQTAGTVQLAFGMMLISLSGYNFMALTAMVRTACQAGDTGQGESVRDIVLPIPSRGISMILTRIEIRRLLVILGEADSEMKVVQLLGLFN